MSFLIRCKHHSEMSSSLSYCKSIRSKLDHVWRFILNPSEYIFHPPLYKLYVQKGSNIKLTQYDEAFQNCPSTENPNVKANIRNCLYYCLIGRFCYLSAYLLLHLPSCMFLCPCLFPSYPMPHTLGLHQSQIISH